MKPHNRWEHFTHGADIGVRGIGDSIAHAFEMGGLALIGVITNPDNIVPTIEISISCYAPDYEILFLDWLNAIIYQIETKDMLFAEFHVDIAEPFKLNATIKGEKINRLRHQPVSSSFRLS